MEININIDTDGEAFAANGWEKEVSKILGDLSRKTLRGHVAGMTKDSNGNPVGDWSIDGLLELQKGGANGNQ